MAKCGNCGKPDATVAEIRECYGARMRSAESGGEPGVFKLTGEDSLHSLVANVELEEDKLYELDGQVYLVKRSQSSGYLYATTPKDNGGFAYVPGMIPKLRTGGAVPLTMETAAAFGKLTNYCCVCGRKLDNREPGCSVDRGYGPICAGKLGWPWGPSGWEVS